MKKIYKFLAMAISLIVMTTAFGACGGGGNSGGIIKPSEVGPNTITIKCVRAGFGTDWLSNLKIKFEQAYAEEGYKLNILTPDRSINGENVINELHQGYDKMKVDLYITGDIKPDSVGAEGNYGVVAADLRDLVYNQKAIGFDGVEEDELVSDKLSDDIVPFTVDSHNVMYGFNWVQSSGGLVANTKKLSAYGLSLPKTTNQMFDCFEKIYLGNNGVGSSVATGTYPLTFVSGNNGYAVCFLNTLMAQYDADFYEKFWTLEENGVAMVDDGYEVFNDPVVTEMLKIAYQTFDLNITAPGSATHELGQAQGKIMSGANVPDNAIFMFNGDWMLNEVKLTYKNQLSDIDFINFPVISSLGTKLFGAGTSYALSDDKCEELLAFIIDLVDENKEISEIITSVKSELGIDLAEAEAKEVARARGVSYSRGVEHLAFIPKDSPKKDISSLLLRMMASDDFAESFSVLANGTTPYHAVENTTSEYAFVRNATKIPSNKYYSLISSGARGYRAELNLNTMFYSQSHLPDYIWTNFHDSIYNDDGTLSGDTLAVYAKLAADLQKEEYTSVTNNWENMKN